MASSPTKDPVHQFVIIPMVNNVLNLEKLRYAGTQPDADSFARELALADEDCTVVTYQAVKVQGAVKKVDVLWTPRGVG